MPAQALEKLRIQESPRKLAPAALGVVARAHGMTRVARDAGVTLEALYKTLSAEGDPRLSTLLGVMKALNITLRADRAAGAGCEPVIAASGEPASPLR